MAIDIGDAIFARKLGGDQNPSRFRHQRWISPKTGDDTPDELGRLGVGQIEIRSIVENGLGAHESQIKRDGGDVMRT